MTVGILQITWYRIFPRGDLMLGSADGSISVVAKDGKFFKFEKTDDLSNCTVTEKDGRR